jgi:large subunit ribosomal protein L24
MAKDKVEPRGKISLRRGDTVMVISGGNKKTRPLKGKTGKILRFVGRGGLRAVVEGLNFVTRHQRARSSKQQAAKIQKEAPMQVSRLMYYVEKLKKPVRLCHGVLADGSRVRGYRDPKTKEFVQVAD